MAQVGSTWIINPCEKNLVSKILSHLKVQKEEEDFNSNKLLYLVGDTTKYSLLNGLVIVHMLTERYTKMLHIQE